jgi:hypothetical protein
MSKRITVMLAQRIIWSLGDSRYNVSLTVFGGEKVLKATLMVTGKFICEAEEKQTKKGITIKLLVEITLGTPGTSFSTLVLTIENVENSGSD